MAWAWPAASLSRYFAPWALNETALADTSVTVAASRRPPTKSQAQVMGCPLPSEAAQARLASPQTREKLPPPRPFRDLDGVTQPAHAEQQAAFLSQRLDIARIEFYRFSSRRQRGIQIELGLLDIAQTEPARG